MQEIKEVNAKNIRPFGRVIEYPRLKSENSGKTLFRKVIVEPLAVGWRIIYLVVRDKSIDRLEQHQHTYESFEPVSGRSLIFLAGKSSLRDISCFYLNRPVVLNKGIWHAVVTLDKQAEIKITENAKVKSRYWKLGIRLKVFIRGKKYAIIKPVDF